MSLIPKRSAVVVVDVLLDILEDVDDLGLGDAVRHDVSVLLEWMRKQFRVMPTESWLCCIKVFYGRWVQRLMPTAPSNARRSI